MKTITRVLLCAAVLLLWAGVADAQTLVRTAQMWGTDKSDGKVDATLGIAGECIQTGGDLTCQFVSLSLSADKECSVIVSAWTEHLRRVSRTHDEVRWGGTKGPSGMAGVLTTTILIAKRSEWANKGKDDFFNMPAYGPGAADTWSYQATTMYTNLVLGKKMSPGVTEVAGPTTYPKFCQPTEAMLMAISPAAAD